MRNNLYKKPSKVIPLRANEFDFYDHDQIGINKQILLLNQQLLIDKEKAEEKERIKSAFLANIIHEIRTPMNAVRGFAELLKTPYLAEENKDKYVQIICQCTDNLLNLVNDLLDISKIEAKQLAIIEREGNLKDLFDELFELFDNPLIEFKSENVKLKSYIGLNQEMCLINADFIRLRQILINLIANALKFTEKGHVIFGCCLVDNKTLCFYVDDTGIGIHPEKLSTIFEPFRQINDLNSASNLTGTGLGLTIVKSLVELMNGKVWVESIHGTGSRFYFTLPYRKSTYHEVMEESSPIFDWSKKNILIVENDDFFTFLINKYLANTKANCIFVKDSKSALKYIKSFPSIDLVLMDAQLPDTKGFVLVKKIKRIAKNIPIIAQTATYTKNERKNALISGCNEYVIKPIYKEELLQIIQNQLTNN
jgi:signal transduction histidine kinase/CheY-like chemotaxis protein